MRRKVRTGEDLYAKLGLAPNACAAEIQAACQRAAETAHPMNGGSMETFHSVKFAFEALSCPVSRELYDRTRFQQQLQRSVNKKRKQSTSHCAANTVAKRQCRANDPFQEPWECVKNKALERLRFVLQSITVDQRRAAIVGMAPSARSELLAFMRTRQQQTLTEPFTCPRNTMEKEVVQNAVFSRGTDVRCIKGLHMTRYQAQLRINHLRMYTREVADIETAIKHQMIFVQFRHAIDAVGESVWTNPDQFCSIFRCILKNKGVSENQFGLRVFVCMRADEWIDRTKTINSPVMALADALRVRSQLLSARQTSWESLRVEWVALMLRTHHARTKLLSQADAEAIAEKARQSCLKHHLKQAIHGLHRVLNRKKHTKASAHAKLTKSYGFQCNQV